MMARRLKRFDQTNIFDDNLVSDLIDESKHYEVANGKNWWDRTMKISSYLTKRYVTQRRIWDKSFCKHCDIFLDFVDHDQ